jgi:hypothetical protein
LLNSSYCRFGQTLSHESNLGDAFWILKRTSAAGLEKDDRYTGYKERWEKLRTSALDIPRSINKNLRASPYDTTLPTYLSFLKLGPFKI